MPRKLVDMDITAVAGVDRAANKRKWLIVKAAGDPEQSPKEVSPTEKPSLLKRLKETVAKMMGMNGSKGMTMDQMMTIKDKEEELWSKEWRMRDAFDSSIRSIMSDEGMDMEKRKEMLGQTMEQYHAKLMEHMNAMVELMQSVQGNAGTTDGAVDMSKDDAPEPEPDPDPNVNKKDGEDQMTTFDEVMKSLSEAQRQLVEAELAKRAASVPEEVSKRLTDAETKAAQVADLQKRAETAEARATDAEAKLAAEVAKRQTEEYLVKAARYPAAGTAEQVAAKLRKAYSLGEEFGKEFEATLEQTEKALKDAKLFQPVGKSGKAPEGSAEAKLETLAKSRAAEAKISYEQAYDQILTEHPDLYKQYRTEERGS